MDDGRAGRATVGSSAAAEKELIVADAAASNAKLDQELKASQAGLAGHVGAAKALATAAVGQATGNAQAFLITKQAEVIGAATAAEQAAMAQATVMTAAAQGQAAATHAQLSATVASIASGLQGRVSGVANQIAGAITGVSLPDLPGVGMIRNGIASLVRGAAGSVTSGINFVQGIIGRALSTGLRVVTTLIGKASTVVMDVVRQIATKIRTAAAKVAGALMTIAGKVGKALGAFLRGVVFPALDRVRTTMSTHLVKGHKAAKLAVKTNTDYHLDALAKVAKTAPGVGSQAGGGAAGGGEDPLATFRSIGKSAHDNNQLVVNTFGGRLGAVLAGVTAMALGAARNVADRVKAVASQVISTVSGKVQEAIGAVKQIAAAIGGFLSGILTSLRQAFSGAIEWVRNLVTKPIDELVSFGSKALSKATSFISTAISNVLRGNFSLPSLGLGSFQPAAANDAAGPVQAEAVTASFGTSATGVLKIIGIVIAALVGLVLLPFILATVVGVALIAAAALCVFGPLLAVIALVVYGIYRLIKWIATPSKLEVTHTTSLDAPDGSPKSRSIVGVGERVTLEASKLSSWKASAGEPTSAAPKAKLFWKAPSRAGSAEITADVVDKSMSEKVSFTVVEPASVTSKKEKEVGFAAGEQGAGMTLQFIYGPANVSFGGLGAKERSGPASGITGYYTHEGMPHDHKASSDFSPIAANNQLAGDFRDSAKQEGMPKPWEAGSFHWDIPNEFRVDESEASKVFATQTQEFVMADDTGTTTVTKGGASVTRKP